MVERMSSTLGTGDTSRYVVIVLAGDGPMLRAFARTHDGPLAILSREESGNQLSDAVTAVLQGRHYVSPGVATEAISAIVGQDARAPTLADPEYESLTRRERQVFGSIVDGKSNKEIAFELGLSHKTVETYRGRIREKLGTCDPIDLSRRALRIGLIDAHDWALSS